MSAVIVIVRGGAAYTCTNTHNRRPSQGSQKAQRMRTHACMRMRGAVPSARARAARGVGAAFCMRPMPLPRTPLRRPGVKYQRRAPCCSESSSTRANQQRRAVREQRCVGWQHRAPPEARRPARSSSRILALEQLDGGSGLGRLLGHLLLEEGGTPRGIWRSCCAASTSPRRAARARARCR